jgi:hypothetical protein
MKRCVWFLAVPCAALVLLGTCEARAANVQFNFNADADGRLLVGTDASFPSIPAALLWEMNDFQVDGAKVCAVPEPASLAMAGAAAACGIGGFAGRRRSRRSDGPVCGC